MIMNFGIVYPAVLLYAASVADLCHGHDTDDIVLASDMVGSGAPHVDL